MKFYGDYKALNYAMGRVNNEGYYNCPFCTAIGDRNNTSVYYDSIFSDDSESLDSDTDSDFDFKTGPTYLHDKSIKKIKEKEEHNEKEKRDNANFFKLFDKYKQKSTEKIITNTDLKKFDCTRISNFNLKKNLDKSQFEIINLQIEKKLTKGVVDRFLKILYDTVERSPNLNTLYRSERTLLTNCWKEFEFCHFDSPVLKQKNNPQKNIKGDFEIKTPVIKLSQSIRQFLSVDRFSNLFSKKIENGTSPNKRNFKAQQFTSFQNYQETVLDNCEEDEIPICISFYYDHHYCNNKISIGGLYFLIENIPVCWRSRKETIFLITNLMKPLDIYSIFKDLNIIEDIQNLQKGFIFNNKKYKLFIMKFYGDYKALNYAMGRVNNEGYYNCPFCTAKGDRNSKIFGESPYLDPENSKIKRKKEDYFNIQNILSAGVKKDIDSICEEKNDKGVRFQICNPYLKYFNFDPTESFQFVIDPFHLLIIGIGRKVIKILKYNKKPIWEKILKRLKFLYQCKKFKNTKLLPFFFPKLDNFDDKKSGDEVFKLLQLLSILTENVLEKKNSKNTNDDESKKNEIKKKEIKKKTQRKRSYHLFKNKNRKITKKIKKQKKTEKQKKKIVYDNSLSIYFSLFSKVLKNVYLITRTQEDNIQLDKLILDFFELHKKNFGSYYKQNFQPNLHRLFHLAESIKNNGGIFSCTLALERFHQNFKSKYYSTTNSEYNLLRFLTFNYLKNKFIQYKDIQENHIPFNKKIYKRGQKLINIIHNKHRFHVYEFVKIFDSEDIFYIKKIYVSKGIDPCIKIKLLPLKKRKEKWLTKNTFSIDYQNQKIIKINDLQKIVHMYKPFKVDKSKELNVKKLQEKIKLNNFWVLNDSYHSHQLLNLDFVYERYPEKKPIFNLEYFPPKNLTKKRKFKKIIITPNKKPEKIKQIQKKMKPNVQDPIKSNKKNMKTIKPFNLKRDIKKIDFNILLKILNDDQFYNDYSQSDQVILKLNLNKEYRFFAKHLTLNFNDFYRLTHNQYLSDDIINLMIYQKKT
ncbi:n-acetyltransferase eco [Anaeramoeba flamelloides]|uniref:N-acetyltransferase eco n=1 Tax=Anaeramoeba flamelloides TaxID=1746091 RepID=A0ABQ8Z2T5_9EUKA|nr:n-acetyltransferase eco [Anaeramoeba flamelloides]